MKEEPIEKGSAIPEINFKTPGRFKQMLVFIKRDILSKVADTQYLLITLLEAPILAFFLAFLIRYFDESVVNPRYTLYENSNLPVYIFMSVIVAIFMGLTVSAEEIIKDRKILKREAFLNLSWNSYLMSKVFVQFSISAIQALTFVIIGNSITGIRGMWFEYWLILFTCWAGANMLGLVISDSFKAVVTIYILIPFLVIPQIILSGIMVKFEKLNPTIPMTNPVSIPFYGEFITARWGYEALAVKQFKDNKYERQFYVYDRAMSKARYKKDYWHAELKGKLESLRSDLERGNKAEDFNKRLLVAYNEIRKEQELTPDVKFEYPELLKPDKVTTEILGSALSYVDLIRRYYIAYYNNAKDKKDATLTRMQGEDSEKFFKMRDNHSNESLEEFVTSANETVKIVEFDGEIIQKLDPVFMEPRGNFIKAHFYAPEKKFFGITVDTFVINTIVLWFMTFLLYFVLYFRLLKKILDSGEVAIGKKFKE
jgi:hypothetical protein